MTRVETRADGRSGGSRQPLGAGLRLLCWMLVPLLYYGGAKLGALLALMPEGIAILWPANSVLLTAMLLGRRRDIPLIAVLGAMTEVLADIPAFTVSEALVFGVTNAAEAAIACLLLKMWRFDARLATLADLRKFMVAAPLLATGLAVSVGAAVYETLRASDSTYLELLRVWFLGDAMGLLIFTPLLLSLTTRPLGGARPPAVSFGAVDAVVILIGAALTASLASSRDSFLSGLQIAPLLLIPCVVYLATRFDLRVASVAAAIVGVAIAYATAHGYQPFGNLAPHEAALRAQEFILTTSLLGLGLAALIAQLKAGQRDLHQANRQLDQLNRSLEERVTQRTAQLDAINHRLEQLALTDPLTGLLNRRAFFAEAHRAVENALRHGRSLAAIMIDIDHFKAINDAHGHATGDHVLSEVAATLNSMVRGADRLARYGGEEFVLLAPETELANALALAIRMGDELRSRPVPIEDGTITVTASFGVTALDGRGDTLDRMMARADQALYACKNAGRDQAIAVAPPDADASPPRTVPVPSS